MIRPVLTVLIVIFLVATVQASGIDDLMVGTAALQRRDYDQAIQFLTRALNSGELTREDQARAYALRGGAYVLRGNAYLDKGDDDAAIRDYDAAIRDSNDGLDYWGRGFAYFAKGDYDAAIRDFDAAIRLNPNYALAYSNRGELNFLTGRFAEAATDFANSLRIDPKQPNDVLWLHMSRARAGQPDADEFARNTTTIDRNTWPGPVVRFFLREIPSDLLLAAAESPDTVKRRTQRCQALFFVGEQEIVNQNLPRARELLREALDTCPLSSRENLAAKAELSRMGN